jgi:hypothetical protein
MRIALSLCLTLLSACSTSSSQNGTTGSTTTSATSSGAGGAGGTMGAGGSGTATTTTTTTGAGGGLGAGGMGGMTGTSEDAGAPSCADPKAGIGWAGDWGTILSHGCIHSLGLGDPFLFDLSNAGHDCQQITADVWVPGITDVDGDPAAIRAEALTTMGSAAQPPELASSTLLFIGRVGNNYRYVWTPYLGSGVVPVGSYAFSFRFSAGAENQGCWYRIGLGEGPGGGQDRTAKVEP